MIHHPRTPAALAFAVTLALGIAAPFVVSSVTTGGADRSIVNDHSLLDDYEAAIDAGKIDAAMAYNYAEQLRANNRFAAAARGYRRFLAVNSRHEGAQFHLAICLAKTDSEGFYNFMNELQYQNPKQVLNIFQQPDAVPYLAEDRFQEIHENAKPAALD
jgi:hypothetical protein